MYVFQYDTLDSGFSGSYPADVRSARTVFRAQISKNGISGRSARSERRKMAGAETNGYPRPSSSLVFGVVDETDEKE